VSELLGAALSYLERGWAVLPVVPKGKVPLTRHGLKDATTDRDQIEAWWRRWPQANVAVATGPPSGLLVVDLDGETGLGSWARLEARYGVTLTLEASTGGGGVHLVYGYPSDVDLGNSAGRLGEGIDTRGRGGYVLVAPSVHPSGRRYTWTGSGETPITPAPAWLVDLLRPPPSRPVPARKREWQPGDDRRQLARFNGLLDTMAAARPRQRNDRLFWCGCRLRELLAEGAPPAWIELLVEAGVATGLGEAEVRRTIKSALEGPAQ
jgi:Bifunctional DNA primase/polymerase, N-terminal